MRIQLDQLDHIVFTVKSPADTCDFYTRIFGMQKITFDGNRKALVFGKTKINLHQSGSEFEPKAQNPVPGSIDVCFTTPSPIPEVLAHLEKNHVTVIDGPVNRTGVLGPMTSVYFRDPDGNLIEVSYYDDRDG